LLAER